MTRESVDVRRPDRWDHPLSADMTSDRVTELLKIAPFRDMDAARFARNTPLADILRNDARILEMQAGDIVFREGQYGESAYLVLAGSVRVMLERLQPDGGKHSKGIRSWGWLRHLGGKESGSGRDRRARKRGVKAPGGAQDDLPTVSMRGHGSQARLFLQDVPGVLSRYSTSEIAEGELFGELSAVTRSPREFTALASEACTVLEIRWQGLKLLKQDAAFRRLLDERYRNEVLQTHLRETMLFRYVPDEELQRVVAAAKFESFGDLEWYARYRRVAQQSASQLIDTEPLIAEEGEYATGLWIIRGGFARLSRRQGAGHRTLAYMGKGHLFGLRELAHNSHRSSQEAPLPYQESLRAIGYVDAICVPKQAINEHVLPYVRRSDLPATIERPRYRFDQPVVDAPLEAADHNVETGLLEFLVEHRLNNGQRTMAIDMERCTRCDDCVRACASTHGGEPVFVRKGPQHGPWMFAQACMHCEDPVCMIGCPTGAIHRERDSGLVQINDQTCIGCKSCAESCPYENIRMVRATDERGRAKIDHATGLPILQASKCDFCSDLGRRPSCQAACPHDALVRIDMSDLSQVSQVMQRRAS